MTNSNWEAIDEGATSTQVDGNHHIAAHDDIAETLRPEHAVFPPSEAGRLDGAPPEDDLEARVARKPKSGPRIAAAVVIAVAIAAVGFMAWKVMGPKAAARHIASHPAQVMPMQSIALAPAPELVLPRPAAVIVPSVELPAVAPQGPVSSAVPGPGTSGAHLGPDQSGAQALYPPQMSPASTRQSPPAQAPAAQTAVQPLPQVPAVAGASVDVQRLKKTVQDLTAEIARLRVGKTVSDAVASTGPLTGAQAVGEAEKAQPSRLHGRTSHVHVARNGKVKSSQEKSAAVVPDDIARLQLKGVYPPHGQDMRAFVMDGEILIQVAKGEKINGARVLRVERDQVITTAGTIH